MVSGGLGCDLHHDSAQLAGDGGVDGAPLVLEPRQLPQSEDGSIGESDDAPFAQKRAACAFKQGALPSQTFGSSIAKSPIPIDTIVIVTQENRSFDEYYTGLPMAGQRDAEVTPPNLMLVNAKGQSYAPYHETALCVDDPPHDWDSMHKDWDFGHNDGFLLTDGPGAYPSLGYYEQPDLAFYYALATTYAISDHYFAAVLGPTWPNRLYLYEGSSSGHVVNVEQAPPGHPNIFAELKKAGIAFSVYSGGSLPMDAGAPDAGRVDAGDARDASADAPPHGGHVDAGVTPPPCPGPVSFETSLFCSETGPAKTLADFQRDAAAGKLPAVSWIYAGQDEHPVEDIQQGEADVQTFYNALVASPQWPHAAFIITYDEGGGFFDHVPPPQACLPDSIPPDVPGEAKIPGSFNRYGFRVPLIVASPYARRHYVSHVTASHTSLLRFLELRFDLPACSDRDANADPLLDLFDFEQPTFLTPVVPPAIIVANPTTRGC